ncbi:MAG: MBL fold metallo-hydrolase [Candidatus Methylacidiphilales bacterium]|nr:MBL fold metallo-hydrolase [Candidatus Methylacidiphilales bacterium]
MIPLEDFFYDIVSKAQRGLKLGNGDVADAAGVSLAEVEELKRGKLNEPALRKIAPVLKLSAARLIDLANNAWYPKVETPADGFAAFNTPFEDMTVNSYLLWDPATKEGVAFDTGASCVDMLAKAKACGVTIRLILLTHSHGDHIFDLPALLSATSDAPVWINEAEADAVPEAQTFASPQGSDSTRRSFNVGCLAIEARPTVGHSRGGTTYVVHGLEIPGSPGAAVAIVGDAVFAGSMGGGAVSYSDALRTNREYIYTLPDETILCPGHGPLTTVGEEKRHNPFAVEFEEA